MSIMLKYLNIVSIVSYVLQEHHERNVSRESLESMEFVTEHNLQAPQKQQLIIERTENTRNYKRQRRPGASGFPSGIIR